VGGLIASTTHYHILWSTAADKCYRRNQAACTERLRSVQLYPGEAVFFWNWFRWWECGTIYFGVVNAIIFLFRSFLMIPVPEIGHMLCCKTTVSAICWQYVLNTVLLQWPELEVVGGWLHVRERQKWFFHRFKILWESADRSHFLSFTKLDLTW